MSRSAGPTHRFINALPHPLRNGDLRVTEQGETAAQKHVYGGLLDERRPNIAQLLTPQAEPRCA
ncbi:MAG: hypothetical protein ACK47M_04565 [Caldilinea sp.]